MSGDQAADQLSEDPAARNAQEALQSGYADSPIEPFHAATQVAMQYVIGGLVCPLPARNAQHIPILAAIKVKSG